MWSSGSGSTSVTSCVAGVRTESQCPNPRSFMSTSACHTTTAHTSCRRCRRRRHERPLRLAQHPVVNPTSVESNSVVAPSTSACAPHPEQAQGERRDHRTRKRRNRATHDRRRESDLKQLYACLCECAHMHARCCALRLPCTQMPTTSALGAKTGDCKVPISSLRQVAAGGAVRQRPIVNRFEKHVSAGAL